MMDPRSSSALFKRAEQLKRWEESDTNKQSPTPKRASRIQFSSGIVFLAACTAGDKDEVQRLLKMGADINTANVDGLTALHQTSGGCRIFGVACVRMLLVLIQFTSRAIASRTAMTHWNTIPCRPAPEATAHEYARNPPTDGL
ncbi:unnamed protein product, partial [Iphiclides podalirius]